MCTLKDVSVPIYTTILNDDGRYYIYKWDVVKHQYGDDPLNKKVSLMNIQLIKLSNF